MWATVLFSGIRCVSVVPEKARRLVGGAGGGIRTPDRLITNQLLYRTELRQPDKEQIIALPVPYYLQPGKNAPS